MASITRYLKFELDVIAISNTEKQVEGVQSVNYAFEQGLRDLTVSADRPSSLTSVSRAAPDCNRDLSPSISPLYAEESQGESSSMTFQTDKENDGPAYPLETKEACSAFENKMAGKKYDSETRVARDLQPV